MENEKIILGIDPGTRILGFGVIRLFGSKAEFVEMGVVNLKNEKDHFSALRRILSEVSAIMEKYLPDELAIESPFYGKNAQVMLKLGRAQGAAITAALRRGIPVYEYAPRKAKLAITGVGQASKEQVSIMIQKILGVTLENRFLDATDALALAMCHYYRMTDPLADVKSSSDWKKFIEQNPDKVVK